MSQEKIPCVEIDQNCLKDKRFDSAGKRKLETKDDKIYIPDPPDEVELQASTVRFIAYIIVAIVTFFISLLILSNALSSYLVYAKHGRFPGPFALFFGLLFSTIIVAYVCYTVSAFNPARANIIFWLFLFFNICYMAWVLNLSVRADSFANGANYNGRGSFYITLMTIFALGILFLAWEYSVALGVLMLLAVLWIVYLVYIWIFDGTIFLPETI